jgi:endonuclease/exonuclease/phosphatase family metal-dependent hydrolase
MQKLASVFSSIFLFSGVLGCPGFPVGEEDGGSENTATDGGNGGSDYPAPRTDITGTLGSDTTLDIATWNIENFPKATTTPEFMADLIASMDIDLVAVQEITSESAFEELLDRLPNHEGTLSSHTYSDGTFQKVGFIYKTPTIELTDTNLLFSGSGYNFPRPPLQSTVSVYADNALIRSLTAIVIHLKAGVDPESTQRRTDALIALEGYLQSQVDGPGNDDIILLGDFNDVLTNDFGLEVFAPFTDSSGEYTVHTWDLAQAGGETYLPSRSILDHIVSTISIGPSFNLATIPDLDGEFWNYENSVSDHLPVVISLPNP